MKIQTDFNVVWSAWDGDSDPDENRVQGHGMTEWTAINDLVEKLISAALEKNPNGTSQVGGERQRAIKEPGQSTSALRYPGSNPGDDPAPSDSALTVARLEVAIHRDTGVLYGPFPSNAAANAWVEKVDPSGTWSFEEVMPPYDVQRTVQDQGSHYHDEAATSLSKAVQDERERCLSAIPTTWLDPLLSGNNDVLGNPPWNCSEIEALCKAIRKRIEGPK